MLATGVVVETTEASPFVSELELPITAVPSVAPDAGSSGNPAPGVGAAAIQTPASFFCSESPSLSPPILGS